MTKPMLFDINIDMGRSPPYGGGGEVVLTLHWGEDSSNIVGSLSHTEGNNRNADFALLSIARGLQGIVERVENKGLNMLAERGLLHATAGTVVSGEVSDPLMKAFIKRVENVG